MTCLELRISGSREKVDKMHLINSHQAQIAQLEVKLASLAAEAETSQIRERSAQQELHSLKSLLSSRDVTIAQLQQELASLLQSSPSKANILQPSLTDVDFNAIETSWT